MKPNIHSIQFLRFIAAALVVQLHIAQEFIKVNPDVPSWAMLNGLGQVGVHIFFIISGFVMVYTSFDSINDRSFNWRTFLSRRFLRIFPIYWVYAAICMALIGPALSSVTIPALLLLPGAAPYIIYPAWTLTYELYFYAWFALTMGFGVRRGLPILTTFFFSFVIAERIFRVQISDSELLKMALNPILIEFIAGAWIGYAVLAGVRFSNAAANALTLAGVTLLVGSEMMGRPSVIVGWGGASALLIAGLTFRELNGTAAVPIRSLAWLGDGSYSLYLLHVLCIGLVVSALHAIIETASTTTLILLAISILAGCVLVGELAYRFIEKPLVRTLRNPFRVKRIDAATQS